MGYLFTLPLVWDETLSVPNLADTAAPDLSGAQPNCLYLHDLAVAPQHRGRGISRLLFDTAQALARNRQLNHMALVAVQDSAPFWLSLGFTPMATPHPQIQTKLASYGEGALLMLRTT